MRESSTGENEPVTWGKAVFDNDDQRKGFERIVEWAEQRELMETIAGDSYLLAFPRLPGSNGWLTVSVLEGAVIVSFARLKGYPPFVGKARARMMKQMRLGAFVQEDRKQQYAKVELADLSDDYQWKLLKWRLNLIAAFAGLP